MVTKRDPKVQLAPAYKLEKRRLRRPTHRFTLRARPYVIQPFMIAPVIPGETLSNLLLQARVVTDPLKPDLRLVGWWNEFFFFYVKHRDFDEPARTTVTNMMLDPATDVSALRDVAGNFDTYTFPGAIDWMSLCMDRIIDEYFRDDGESSGDFTLDGMPIAKIFGRGSEDWTESLTLEADRTYNENVDLIDGSGNLTPDTFINQWNHWLAVRDAGLTEMDYEDFVRTYGGNVREDEESPNLHRPEVIRYVRNFQYPTNVVEPTTGVPATAVAWSVAERADKDRRFDEPGFLVGLMCNRPKVYLGNQQGSAAGLLDNVYGWLPPVVHQQFDGAYKLVAAGEGPFADLFMDGDPAAPSGYWVDVRDLYIYGDQFSNYDLTGASGTVALPTSANQRRYASEADIDALFKDVASNKIYADGVVNLGIKGRQSPRSPTTRI